MKKPRISYVSNSNNRIDPMLPSTNRYSLTHVGLDPPLLLYLPRLVIRTFLRLFRLRPPCAPGCEERIGEVFSKKSIICWCISNHWNNREQNKKRMQQIGLGIGSDVERRRMRRMGGWGSELKRWLGDVQKMVESRRAKRD